MTYKTAFCIINVLESKCLSILSFFLIAALLIPFSSLFLKKSRVKAEL